MNKSGEKQDLTKFNNVKNGSNPFYFHLCTAGKSSKGSILAFTLIVMTIILIIALGIAKTTVTQMRNAGATGKSTMAFQIADSGTEIVLKSIKKDNKKTPADFGVSCTVEGGKAGITASTSSGPYRVIFKNSDGNEITSCSSYEPIEKIKSVGTYGNTSRAVEAEVCNVDAWTSAGSVGNRAANSALGTFNNQVYIGTGDYLNFKNAAVYVYNGGTSWGKIIQFTDQYEVTTLYDGTADPGNFLWVGTFGTTTIGNGGLYQYRATYNSGVPEKVFDFNFPFGSGNSGFNRAVYDVEFFKNRFYIATGSEGTISGKVFRSSDNTGDKNQWESVPVLAPPNTYRINNLYISNDGEKLYATAVINNGTDVMIYVSSDGTNWSNFASFSFTSTPDYRIIEGIIEYKGKIYVTLNKNKRIGWSTGMEGAIYVFDGSSWSNLQDDYPSLPNIYYGDLVVFDNGSGKKLYIGGYSEDIRIFDGNNITITLVILGGTTDRLAINKGEDKIYTDGTATGGYSHYNPPCR